MADFHFHEERNHVHTKSFCSGSHVHVNRLCTECYDLLAPGRGTLPGSGLYLFCFSFSISFRSRLRFSALASLSGSRLYMLLDIPLGTVFLSMPLIFKYLISLHLAYSVQGCFYGRWMGISDFLAKMVIGYGIHKRVNT